VCAGDYAAGTHELSWDGRSDQGERVAPGLYFVRMAAGPDRRELKLVMTR